MAQLKAFAFTKNWNADNQVTNKPFIQRQLYLLGKSIIYIFNLPYPSNSQSTVYSQFRPLFMLNFGLNGMGALCPARTDICIRNASIITATYICRNMERNKSLSDTL